MIVPLHKAQYLLSVDPRLLFGFGCITPKE
jgi:hypothetical protein